MKGSRFTEEQVLAALQQQESRQKTVEAVCHELGISQSTFFTNGIHLRKPSRATALDKWKKKYGGMTLSEAKRLRILEAENARLKRLLSERTLELDALHDMLSAAVA